MGTIDTGLDLSSAVAQFWSAPAQALFPQTVLVAVTGLSHAHFERARWSGTGPKFIKLGRMVRYRKADVVDWIEKRQAVSSTTEAEHKLPDGLDLAQELRTVLDWEKDRMGAVSVGVVKSVIERLEANARSLT